MFYISYPILALAPSTVWLLFYLRKDSHPESNRTILKIFFYGMLAAIPVALIELGFTYAISHLLFPRILISAVYFFVGVAFTEEIFKYFVVNSGVLKSSELDEPLDIMLYMIIAALGFAATENLLYLWLTALALQESIILAAQRFIGATFLHALTSGTFGYFLAISLAKPKKQVQYLFLGLFLAVALHGLFNFSIMEVSGLLKLEIPLGILIGLALFVSWGFQQLKKLPSTCRVINE